MSSTAADRAAPQGSPPADPARAGFMLVEVLVAVVVAGLFLAALGRAMAGAWGATRAPVDVLTAVSLARAELPAGRAGRPAGPPPRGYSVSRSIGTVQILVRPSGLPPAPILSQTAALPGLPVQAPTPGVTQHTPAAGATGQLQRVSVTVRSPTGRSVRFETVRLDAPPT